MRQQYYLASLPVKVVRQLPHRWRRPCYLLSFLLILPALATIHFGFHEPSIYQFRLGLEPPQLNFQRPIFRLPRYPHTAHYYRKITWNTVAPQSVRRIYHSYLILGEQSKAVVANLGVATRVVAGKKGWETLV